jgi:hypothetical protein
MRKELGNGDLIFDMGSWPVVQVSLVGTQTVEEGEEPMQKMMDEMVSLLSDVILSAYKRGLRFRLTVHFGMSVSTIFATCAPFILQFALAMAREDLLKASGECLEETCVSFSDPDDEPLIEVVTQLIAHIPQSSPIVFKMATATTR